MMGVEYRGRRDGGPWFHEIVTWHCASCCRGCVCSLHKQVKDMGVYATSLHGKMLEVANYYKELVNEYRKNLKAEAENVIKG